MPSTTITGLAESPFFDGSENVTHGPASSSEVLDPTMESLSTVPENVDEIVMSAAGRRTTSLAENAMWPVGSGPAIVSGAMIPRRFVMQM